MLINKIANSNELEAELRKLLAYAQSENPSRQVLAQDLQVLSVRVAGKIPPQFLEHIKKKDDDGDQDDKADKDDDKD